MTADLAGRPPAEWWRAQAVDRPPPGPGPQEARTPGSAVPFAALMAFTFIFFIAPQTLFPMLGVLRIALVAATFAIASFLFGAIAHRRPVPFPPEVRIAVCLVGWAAVTLPLSYWPGGSLSFLLGTFLKSVTIFWLLGGVVTTLPRLRWLAWALTLMTIPIAATTLAHFAAGVTMDNRVVGYMAPLTENPNGVALVLSLLLPLALGLFFIARSIVARAVLLAVVTLDVSAVVVTFSRAGFLTLATVLAMYVYRFLRRPERPWAIVICLVLLACAPLVPPGYWQRVGTITDVESDPTGSAQERRKDTLAAMHLVAEDPVFGAGIGQNILALNEERGKAGRLVHNVYLTYAVDLGVPGLLLFLLLLGWCVNDTRLVRRRSAAVPPLRDLYYLAEALLTSLVAFAIGACFHTNAYEFHFYYFGGLAVAARRVYETETAALLRGGQEG